jgi:hypothetical protein
MAEFVPIFKAHIDEAVQKVNPQARSTSITIVTSDHDIAAGDAEA